MITEDLKTLQKDLTLQTNYSQLYDLLKPFQGYNNLGLTNDTQEFAVQFTKQLLNILITTNEPDGFQNIIKNVVLPTHQLDLLKTLITGNIGVTEYFPYVNGAKPKSEKIRLLSQIIDIFIQQYPDESSKSEFSHNVQKLPGLPTAVKQDFSW